MGKVDELHSAKISHGSSFNSLAPIHSSAFSHRSSNNDVQAHRREEHRLLELIPSRKAKQQTRLYLKQQQKKKPPSCLLLRFVNYRRTA